MVDPVNRNEPAVVLSIYRIPAKPLTPEAGTEVLNLRSINSLNLGSAIQDSSKYDLTTSSLMFLGRYGFNAAMAAFASRVSIGMDGTKTSQMESNVFHCSGVNNSPAGNNGKGEANAARVSVVAIAMSSNMSRLIVKV